MTGNELFCPTVTWPIQNNFVSLTIRHRSNIRKCAWKMSWLRWIPWTYYTAMPYKLQPFFTSNSHFEIYALWKAKSRFLNSLFDRVAAFLPVFGPPFWYFVKTITIMRIANVSPISKLSQLNQQTPDIQGVCWLTLGITRWGQYFHQWEYGRRQPTNLPSQTHYETTFSFS